MDSHWAKAPDTDDDVLVSDAEPPAVVDAPQCQIESPNYGERLHATEIHRDIGWIVDRQSSVECRLDDLEKALKEQEDRFENRTSHRVDFLLKRFHQLEQKWSEDLTTTSEFFTTMLGRVHKLEQSHEEMQKRIAELERVCFKARANQQNQEQNMCNAISAVHDAIHYTLMFVPDKTERPLQTLKRVHDTVDIVRKCAKADQDAKQQAPLHPSPLP